MEVKVGTFKRYGLAVQKKGRGANEYHNVLAPSGNKYTLRREYEGDLLFRVWVLYGPDNLEYFYGAKHAAIGANINDALLRIAVLEGLYKVKTVDGKKVAVPCTSNSNNSKSVSVFKM